MFYGCAALTSLDISSFTPTAATNTSFMLAGCTNLVTIYASTSFNVSNITNSANMFTSSTKLKGGNGTTYNASNVTKTYARRDQSGTPGYFTYRAAPTIPSNSPSVPTIQSIKELDTYEGNLTSLGNALSSMLDEILNSGSNEVRLIAKEKYELMKKKIGLYK